MNLNPWEEERPKKGAVGEETVLWVEGSRKKEQMVALKKLQSSTFLEVNNPEPYVCERDVERKPTPVLWPESGVRVSEAEKEEKRSRLFSLAFHMFR